MDSAITTLWTGPFPAVGVSVYNYHYYIILLSPCLLKISAFNANSEDPDQTPRSAASDLGLHYLPLSFLISKT